MLCFYSVLFYFLWSWFTHAIHLQGNKHYGDLGDETLSQAAGVKLFTVLSGLYRGDVASP